VDSSGFRYSLAASFFCQFLLSRPRSYEKPIDLISCKANQILFVSQNIDLDSWANSLRAWPNPLEGWVTWYNKVAKTYQPTWETIGIANSLRLSLSPLEKNENLLKSIGYFWSDALNCFLFGHGPMTPTLLDVVMITGLNISSYCPSTYRLSEVPFKLSSKTECTNWSAFLNQHLKTKGPVTEKEHTAGRSSLAVWPWASSSSLLASLFDNQQNQSARRRHQPSMLQPIFRPSHPSPYWPIIHFFGHQLRGLVVDVEDSCLPKSAGANVAADSHWVWSPWGRGITINPMFSSWLCSLTFLIPFVLSAVGRWSGA
jgi:hypothetical protein